MLSMVLLTVVSAGSAVPDCPWVCGVVRYPAPTITFHVPGVVIPAYGTSPQLTPTPLIPGTLTPSPERIPKTPTPVPGKTPSTPAPVPGPGSPITTPEKEEGKDFVGLNDNPSAPSAEPLAPDQARLIVDLPADAALFVQNQPTRSTLERRHFITPRLNPAKTYWYDLRVEVVREGQPISETRSVRIKPGEVTRASFKDIDSRAAAGK